MSLRTTQQYVSVLAPGDGKLRITNQHISVLVEIDIEEIGHNIGISHEVDYEIERGLITDIGISHLVDITTSRHFSFTSDIGINQDSFETPLEVDIESNIPLSQDVYFPQEYEEDVSHTIGINHEVSSSLIPDIYYVESNLTLSQIADTTTKGRSVESNINLTQTAVGTRSTDLEQYVETNIEFTQEVGRRGTFYAEAITHLSKVYVDYEDVYDDNGNIIGIKTVLVQAGLRHSVDLVDYYIYFDDGHHINIRDTVTYIKVPFIGVDVSATSTLSLSQTVYAGLGVDSTLSLTQEAIGHGTTGTDGTTLSVTQSVGYSISGTREPIHSIGISHGVGFFIVRDDFCDYKILIGSTDATGLPDEPSEPTLTLTDSISLAFPADAPTTTITFNKPEWGNIHEVYQKRISRKTRGGKRIIYRDTSWRKHEVIKITLTGLSETQLFELLDFFLESIAQPIKYIDYESREWTVIILNPEEQIVRDKDGNTVSIEMETI